MLSVSFAPERRPMRIVSLLSSATEIVHTLGLGDRLIGISHECDWPPEAMHLPRVSRSRFDPDGLTSGEIDAAVRSTMEEHGSVYEVDAEALGRLRPDVVLTQAVCEVCAVPTGSVETAVASLAHPPAVVSLDAHTIAGILHSMRQVAEAAGEPERGERAVAALEARLERVATAVAGRDRPRTLALEWLDPPFAPGHWLPEMIEAAGGENLLGDAGAPSRQVAWPEVEALDPDALLVLPCGFGLEDARADAERHRDRMERVAARALRSGRGWIGHASYFSRSGPRVVGGVEAIAAALHPAVAEPEWMAGRLEPWEAPDRRAQ
jgi:iron complex transport system substrate-binding protein